MSIEHMCNNGQVPSGCRMLGMQVSPTNMPGPCSTPRDWTEFVEKVAATGTEGQTLLPVRSHHQNSPLEGRKCARRTNADRDSRKLWRATAAGRPSRWGERGERGEQSRQVRGQRQKAPVLVGVGEGIHPAVAHAAAPLPASFGAPCPPPSTFSPTTPTADRS